MYFLYENEYRIFKPVEFIIRRGYDKKEKNRGDEPTRDTIHPYMEMSQSNSLYRYLKLTKMSRKWPQYFMV
jgi:hypothetical protein